MAPYRWMWSTIGRNLGWYWYRLTMGVLNIRTFWRPVWGYDACDYSGLLELMEVALRRMRNLHRDHGITLDEHKIVRQLTVTAELCRRLRENEYFENAGFRGEQWCDDKIARTASHAVEMEKQDAAYLGRMFRYVLGWWN